MPSIHWGVCEVVILSGWARVPFSPQVQGHVSKALRGERGRRGRCHWDPSPALQPALSPTTAQFSPACPPTHLEVLPPANLVAAQRRLGKLLLGLGPKRRVAPEHLLVHELIRGARGHAEVSGRILDIENHCAHCRSASLCLVHEPLGDLLVLCGGCVHGHEAPPVLPGLVAVKLALNTVLPAKTKLHEVLHGLLHGVRGRAWASAVPCNELAAGAGDECMHPCPRSPVPRLCNRGGCVCGVSSCCCLQSHGSRKGTKGWLENASELEGFF